MHRIQFSYKYIFNDITCTYGFNIYFINVKFQLFNNYN